MVNVKFYKNEKIEIPDNIMKSFFDMQRELILKYKDVEGFKNVNENGYFNTVQTKESQKVLKDMAWRTTEELAEMCEAMELKHEQEHLLEELADSLHFLIELCLLSGIDYESFENVVANYESLATEGNLNDSIWNYVYRLGIAENLLKNKPWKESETLSDEIMFRQRLIVAFNEFFRIPKMLGVTMEDLYVYYTRKNKVNNFRIKTKY